MIKCPFCHFDNEDGALFCEQCKSDLAGVEIPSPAAAAVQAVPVMPAMEAMPVGGVVEATPMTGGLAEVVATPVAAPPSEAVTIPVVEVPAMPVSPIPIAEATPTSPPPVMPAAPPTDAVPLPAGAQPRLLVLRGQKRNVEYPIYEGHNFIGRADEKPVDIDLEDQEPPDRVWSSRQHALITFENNVLCVEDLNSSNGTFVNRSKIYPGQKRPLAVNDVIQIGTVQLKVIV